MSSVRSERFGMVLSRAEKSLLHRLAQHERIPAAAVVRRLIWQRALQLDLVHEATDFADTTENRSE